MTIREYIILRATKEAEQQNKERGILSPYDLMTPEQKEEHDKALLRKYWEKDKEDE